MQPSVLPPRHGQRFTILAALMLTLMYTASMAPPTLASEPHLASVESIAAGTKGIGQGGAILLDDVNLGEDPIQRAGLVSAGGVSVQVSRAATGIRDGGEVLSA